MPKKIKPNSLPDTLYPYLALGVAFIVLGVSLSFYYFWRIGFSSDTAMIGLMAKSILERGERPVFVWSVGYQGILLEAYATALAFKIFGIGPMTLSFFNMVWLWVLMGVFYIYVKVISNRWTALLSVLLLTVSTPFFFASVMRPLPNYTETYVFGLILLILNHSLIKYFILDKRVTNLTSSFLFASLGLVSGFAFYTYRQIIYFLCAIGVQLTLLYLRSVFQNRKKPFDLILKSNAFRGLTWFFSAHFLVGLLLFIAHLDTVNLLGHAVRFSPIGMMEVSIFVFIIILLFDFLLRFKDTLIPLWKNAIFLIIGFIVGFSPELYFKYIRHGNVTNRTRLGGNLSEVLNRIEWAFKGNLGFLNIYPASLLQVFLLILMLCLMSGFTFYFFKKVKNFIQGKTKIEEIAQISPLYFMPVIVVPIFALADVVHDELGVRYTLVLLLTYSVILSTSALYLIRKKGLTRVMTLLGLTLFLFNNGRSLITELQKDQPLAIESTIKVLQEKGIQFGYANYWLAYSANYLTQEKLILEPLTTHYCPHYAPQVESANRIAYIDTTPLQLQVIDGKVKIYGRPYRVTEQWEKSGLGFLILDKIL